MNVGVTVDSTNGVPGADVSGSAPRVGVGGGVAVAYVAVATGAGGRSVLNEAMGKSYNAVGVIYSPQRGAADAPQAAWMIPNTAMM